MGFRVFSAPNACVLRMAIAKGAVVCSSPQLGIAGRRRVVCPFNSPSYQPLSLRLTRPDLLSLAVFDPPVFYINAFSIALNYYGWCLL